MYAMLMEVGIVRCSSGDLEGRAIGNMELLEYMNNTTKDPSRCVWYALDDGYRLASLISLRTISFSVRSCYLEYGLVFAEGMN